MLIGEKTYGQQPQATPGMTIGGGGNRNAMDLPMDADGRDWSNGLCDCCNEPGTCMLAWYCPCIVYAKNKHRYEHLNLNGTPDPEKGGDCCSGDCMLHAVITFCGAGWILQFMQRGNVRSRYNIKGGGCGDCCAAFWCSPCESTQEYQELKLEERSLGGHHDAMRGQWPDNY
ncbi:Cell number regulator 11 [Leucoagaricus sp. SymC.cos]|nr:Cell number regulator 11 [Leucoagaricus sp. SymC.cos]